MTMYWIKSGTHEWQIPISLNGCQIFGPPMKESESASGVLGKLLCAPIGWLPIILSSGIFRLPGPSRGSVRLVTVIIEQLFASKDSFFGKYAHSMITSYHYNLGIAIWVRGMVGKFQLVTHSESIKNKLHSNSTSQYVANGQDDGQTRHKAVKISHHKGYSAGSIRWSAKYIITECLHRIKVCGPTSLFRLKRKDEFSRSYIFPRLSASLWEISSPVYSPRYSCLLTLFWRF